MSDVRETDVYRPTEELSRQFQELFDLLNGRLFKNELAPCMVVFSRKRANLFGYYRPIGWKHKNSTIAIPEICLNSENILEAEELEVIQTLVHEMCHHWQFTSPEGKPSRPGYHNRQFAKKMKEVGLYPSSTGKPGGAETGQSMADYIIENGPLDSLYRELKSLGWSIAYVNNSLYRTLQEAIADLVGANPQDNLPGNKPGTKKNKLKYSCPSCGINAWGKPGLELGCLTCDKPLKAQL